jgi:tol-pal system protein YbgF
MRHPRALGLGAAILAGAVGISLLNPRPVQAVAREIVEMLADVDQLLQGQQDLQGSMDTDQGVLKTLLQQSNSQVTKMNATIGGMQKSVRDVNADTGARLDTMSTQMQGLSDELTEINSSVGKLNQQLVTLQGTVQTLDAQIAAAGSVTSAGTANPPSTNSPSPANYAPPPHAPAVSRDVYSDALRDLTNGSYDRSRREFQEYIVAHPSTELASNAQFYLGEIAFAQRDYTQALTDFDKVLRDYSQSFKRTPAKYKKGLTLLALGRNAAGISQLREVIREYPGTEEAKLARAKLHQMGVAP